MPADPIPTAPPAPLRIAVLHSGPLPRSYADGARLVRCDHGAIASFLGVVRDHAHGRRVAALHYQCYAAMAEPMLARLIEEAAQRFDPGLQAWVAHGTGDMLPGDLALAIHAGSAHRAAAFDACRHLVERIKQDLPVWKHERYAEGDAAWLPGS